MNIEKHLNHKTKFEASFKGLRVILLLSISIFAFGQNKISKPWENGPLKVSENHRYLQHENGTPFFWLGDTGWLIITLHRC